jgi:hypothetical protein
MCKSVEGLELFINESNNNDQIIKLIETPQKLYSVCFQTGRYRVEERFSKALENSLITHSDTIRHFRINKKLTTTILSSLKNLKSLDIGGSVSSEWNHLEEVSLPFLQSLKSKGLPINHLINLIESTKGHLTEISISNRSNSNENENNQMIRSIYKCSPNLRYLKLLFRSSDIPDLKYLLINCQSLIGLYVLNYDLGPNEFDWDSLFQVLTTSSSSKNLFKFKFCFHEAPKLDSLKLFFENWKGRRPMLLRTIRLIKSNNNNEYINFIENYKSNEIIENYYYGEGYEDVEDFVWKRN